MTRVSYYDSNGQLLPASEVYDHLEEEWNASAEKGESEKEDIPNE